MPGTVEKTNMSEASAEELSAMLREAVGRISELTDRVAALEKVVCTTPQDGHSVAIPEKSAAASYPKNTAPIAVEAGISEEEVLAISAAIAAWLGLQAHIRQIRLIRSGAWAQQGRATIQASHRLTK